MQLKGIIQRGIRPMHKQMPLAALFQENNELRYKTAPSKGKTWAGSPLPLL